MNFFMPTYMRPFVMKTEKQCKKVHRKIAAVIAGFRGGIEGLTT